MLEPLPLLKDRALRELLLPMRRVSKASTCTGEAVCGLRRPEEYPPAGDLRKSSAGVFPKSAPALGDNFKSPAAIATMEPSQESNRAPENTANPADVVPTGMCLQPETHPITEEQLVNEVRGIYAGLVMVEKKCIEIDRQQSESKEELTNAQWQALIALHRTLLHEHHDFFLASNPPCRQHHAQE
ncbi:hypothetical protein T310_10083, partial [Rasamsonia emersonii CBS 393.64]